MTIPTPEEMCEIARAWMEGVGNAASSGKSYPHDQRKNFDETIFKDYLEIISASFSPKTKSGTLTCRFTVDFPLTNAMGNLHGGATATLFDCATSVAVTPIVTATVASLKEEGKEKQADILQENWQFAGVSRTLNVTYLRPAPIGEECEIESEVVSIGKSLCLIKGVMRRSRDGMVLATCEHNKVCVPPPGGAGAKL